MRVLGSGVFPAAMENKKKKLHTRDLIRKANVMVVALLGLREAK